MNYDLIPVSVPKVPALGKGTDSIKRTALTGLQRHAGRALDRGFPHAGGSFGGNAVHVPRQESEGYDGHYGMSRGGFLSKTGDSERIPKASRRTRGCRPPLWLFLSSLK